MAQKYRSSICKHFDDVICFVLKFLKPAVPQALEMQVGKFAYAASIFIALLV